MYTRLPGGIIGEPFVSRDTALVRFVRTLVLPRATWRSRAHSGARYGRRKKAAAFALIAEAVFVPPAGGSHAVCGAARRHEAVGLLL